MTAELGNALPQPPDLFRAPETKEECLEVYRYHIDELTRFAQGEELRISLFAKMGLAFQEISGISVEMRQYRISIYYAYCRALQDDIYQIPIRKVYDSKGNRIGGYMLDQSEQQEFSVWQDGVAEVHPPTERWRFCEHAIEAFREGYTQEVDNLPDHLKPLIDSHVFPRMFAQMYGVEIGEAERKILADPLLFFFHFDDYFGDALSDTWDNVNKTRKWGFLTNVAHLPLNSDLSIYQFLKMHVMPFVGWYSLYKNNDLYTYLCEEAERTGISVLDLMKLQGKHERAHLTVDPVFYGLMPFEDTMMLREGFVSHFANPQLIPSIVSGAATGLASVDEATQKRTLIEGLFDKNLPFDYAMGNAFVFALGARSGGVSLQDLLASENPIDTARANLTGIFTRAAESVVYEGRFFNTAQEAIEYLVVEDLSDPEVIEYLVEAMKIIATYGATISEEQRLNQDASLFEVGEPAYRKTPPRAKYLRRTPDQRIEVFWVPQTYFCNPFPPSVTGYRRETV